jgi:hypothetical protein
MLQTFFRLTGGERKRPRRAPAKRPTQLRLEQLEQREVLSNLVTKWPQPFGLGTPVRITYSYSNLLDGGLRGGLTAQQLTAGVEEALRRWSSVAPLWFVEVPDSGPPPSDTNYPIAPASAAYIRFGHHPIDGVGHIAAHANYPGTTGLSGDVHFDDFETWALRPLGGTDFIEAATHEIGHTLGLGHEVNVNAIMNPSLGGRYSGPGTSFLLPDDINGIRALYGSGRGSVAAFSRVWNWSDTTLDTVGKPLFITRGPGGTDDSAQRINVFLRTTDGRLMERFWDGYTWSIHDTFMRVAGNPIAVVHGRLDNIAPGDVRIHVFVRGADGNLKERFWDGTAWYWLDTGMAVAGDPVTLIRGNINGTTGHDIRVNVWVRGADGQLKERYWDGSSWGWYDTGRAVSGDPVLQVRGNIYDITATDIRAHLFVRGANGTLLERYWNGSGWSWTDTNMAVAGTPVLLVRGTPLSPLDSAVRMHLWVRGADGRLKERFFDGTSWTWTDTGMAVAGDPVAYLRGNILGTTGHDIRINLFVRGANGNLMQRYWNGSSWAWNNTGMAVAGNPVVLVRGNVSDITGAQMRVNLWVRGANGHLMEAYWDGSSWGWYDTGALVTGDPFVVTRGSTFDASAQSFRAYLYVRRADGRLLERYWGQSYVGP